MTYRARWREAAGRERVKTFTRRADAQRFLIEVEDSKLQGAYVGPAAGKMAFAEWAERWYRTTAGLKPSTRHFYRQLLDNQTLPTFKSASLASIDRMAVREWIAALIEDGPGASRIRNAHPVLSMILDSAVDAKRLAVNVAANMRGLPRWPEREMHFLDAVQSSSSQRQSTRATGSWCGLGLQDSGPGRSPASRSSGSTCCAARSRSPRRSAKSMGRSCGVRRRHTSDASCGCLGSSATSWPPTSPTAPTSRTTWCSPPPAAALSASTSSWSATSSRPR